MRRVSRSARIGALSFRTSPDYEAPNDANADNVYEVTIGASDGNLASTLDIEITVADVNESGVITGPTSADYAENGTAIVAAYSSTDPDGDGHGALPAQTRRDSRRGQAS